MAIEPIVLTAAGDTLEGPLSYTDETNLSGKLGFIYAKLGDHECRHHDVYLYELPTCNVIICPGLTLRIEIPKHIDTYGKLRQKCAKEIELQERKRQDISRAISVTTQF